MILGEGMGSRSGFALVACIVFAVAGPQKQRSVYETEILSSRTTLDQERVVRKAVASERLGEYAAAFKKLSQEKSGERFLYGLMRSYYWEMLLREHVGYGISSPKGMSDFTGVSESSQQVPKVLGGDATALAGYYWWLHMRPNREIGMAPPKMEYSYETIIDGGKPVKVKFARVVADPAKDRRLAELFGMMKKLNPNDPMVLEIAAIRESDASKSYDFMKKAYDAGGKDLFPERALLHLYEKAKKLGRNDKATLHKKELQSWLEANKRSAWAIAFSREHPEFKG